MPWVKIGAGFYNLDKVRCIQSWHQRTLKGKTEYTRIYYVNGNFDEIAIPFREARRLCEAALKVEELSKIESSLRLEDRGF